jgi:U3 small nucleolar RNA-associated protein 22
VPRIKHIKFHCIDLSSTLSSTQTVCRVRTMDNHASKKRKVHAEDGSPSIMFQPEHLISTAQSSPGVLQMQISELVSEVLPSFDAQLGRIDKLLRDVKQCIERLPGLAALTPGEAEQSLRKGSKVEVPFPKPRPTVGDKFTVSFAKPVNINVVGSSALHTSLKTQNPMTIDLAVTMPQVLFQQKDYLNHRYFYKRAYYLAVIAAGIQSSQELSIDCQFACQNGCSLQPVILIRPMKDTIGIESPPETNIRILVGPPDGVFQSSKLLPWKSCIRHSIAGDEGDQRKQSQATPLYNGIIQSETQYTSYLKLLHSASVNNPGFKSASVLVAVWLRQRQFGAEVQNGGFGTFEATAMLALLYHGGGLGDKPVLSSGYEGYQLFRALLHFIATRDFVKHPVTIKADLESSFPATRPPHPIFFDGQRAHNILFKMTSFSFRRLQHESQLTLKALDDKSIDHFSSCFIHRPDTYSTRFDFVIELEMPSQSVSGMLSTDLADRDAETIKKLSNVLARALGDRVNLLDHHREVPKPWHTCEQYPDINGVKVVIGLLVDAYKISRTVDYGPPAEDVRAAASFRKFWGEKAELRRFKDGSILESLIWDLPKGSHSVLEQISLYIIGKHFGKSATKGVLVTGGEDLEHLTHVAQAAPQSPAFSAKLCEVFEDIQKKIRSLPELPLQIRQIAPSSGQFCGTGLEGHLHSGADSPDAADAVIQFESSTKWPDDLEAIQRTKTAFLIKLGELLQESDRSLQACVGIENETSPLLNTSYLEVTSGNLRFRFRIYHDREVSLLEAYLKAASKSSGMHVEMARAVSAYRKTFFHRPKHTQIIRALRTRHLLLVPTIQLFKLWCSSHLLTCHFPGELLDLLVLRVFSSPFPFSEPGGIRSSFLRVLDFVSRWDWRSEPLIIDPNRELDQAQMQTIRARFEGWRQVDPGMQRVVMFAASPHDLEGTTWTANQPSKIAANRLTSLARSAIARVSAIDLRLNMEDLFRKSLDGYDFVIHLDVESRRQETHEVQYKNLVINAPLISATKSKSIMVQLFLDEVQSQFGSCVTLFHDAGRSIVVGGLWNPQLGPRPWKINLAYSSVPTTQGDHFARANKIAILSDIARLGADVIQNIDERILS